MKKRWKYLILFIALSQLMMMLGLIILPPVVQALPGEMRVRIAKVPLGGALLDIGTTPMPTALPIPANAVAQARVEIPVVATPTTKPTETAVSASPPKNQRLMKRSYRQTRQLKHLFPPTHQHLCLCPAKPVLKGWTS